MNTRLITQPISKIINDLSSGKAEAEDLHSRVRLVLEKYAIYRGFNPSQMRLLDLFNSDNNLQSDLRWFISNIPKPEKRTAERHKKYKEEAISNLGSLFRKFTGDETSNQSEVANQSYVLANAPDFLKPLIYILPRAKYSSRTYKDTAKQVLEKDRRWQTPLSENGCYILIGALEVVEKHNVNNLEDLLIKHRTDFRRMIKTIAPSRKWSSIYHYFYYATKKLGFRIPIYIKIAFSLDEFPPTLKKQWENFVDRAPSGWANEPEMVALAARSGVNLKPIEESTIYNYLQGFVYALPFIPYERDLDVRDFLALEPVVISIDGYTTSKLCNPLLESYRKKEWERQTRVKRVGFDSGMFNALLSAIKAVAAYNGIFHQDDFKTHYAAKLDVESRKKNKIAKKQTFSLEWIDKVISDLEVEFISIIEKNKFKLEMNNFAVNERKRALRFCFFYVSLVTLRYLGFRQQCLRNCVYNRHITFNRDGTIKLHWEADEIKNDKLFEIVINPAKHNLAHGRLIRTLKLYHDKVYKYLLKTNRVTVNNQFFLKLDRDGSVVKFKNEQDFYSRFIYWSRSFIEMDKVVNELELILNPHNFRGLAGDWYHDVLGLGIEHTAKALGDSPRTIEREYLRNDQHIATPVLDEASRVLEQRERHAENMLFVEKRSFIEEELRLANQRAAIAESQVQEISVQLDTAYQHISLLQNQLSQNHSEILEKLEGLKAQNDL